MLKLDDLVKGGIYWFAHEDEGPEMAVTYLGFDHDVEMCQVRTFRIPGTPRAIEVLVALEDLHDLPEKALAAQSGVDDVDPTATLAEHYRQGYARGLRETLEEIPTKVLVTEALHRAPLCPIHGVQMLSLRADWWACMVCGRTADYV